ncbi:CDK-activating kinase assembly factor [Violaceomyces palustris]|uniref:CDK-activating kinase assembly factor n=1 Tax=Violaceomyces palustris TaxID=1673888 RepID=A0ACD0P5J7_9BASI|nr:CDK-activating kinase assembly factor [Violaceomyces palustris]
MSRRPPVSTTRPGQVKPQGPPTGGLGPTRSIIDKSGRIGEYSSPDDKCPQCKTDRYLNPRLRLLVSPCYHKMCESCIDRIFSLGPAPCPECGKKVSKNQFSAQTFQDLGVEREVVVRKRVAKLFNRREEEFEDLRAYNDYLEEVEEITFNLINEIDLARTNAKLAQYEAAHRSAIANSAQQILRESEMQASADEREKEAKKAKAERLRLEEEREKEERERERIEIVKELERGGDPDVILERRRQRQREKEERRMREEMEQVRRSRASAAALSSYASGPGGPMGAGEVETRGWSLDMILDFEGPLASLDDASYLFQTRKAPSVIGGLEGLVQRNGNGVGYDDPWLKSSWVTKEQVARYRAGGYDWEKTVWRRGIRAACEGIGIKPLDDNDVEQLPSAHADLAATGMDIDEDDDD